MDDQGMAYQLYVGIDVAHPESYRSVINRTVVEPFAGSGAGAEAAKAQGFHWIGIEIDEAYCEGIANRLTGPTGQLDLASIA